MPAFIPIHPAPRVDRERAERSRDDATSAGPERERLGATVTADGTRFALWSTSAKRASVRLFADAHDAPRTVPLAACAEGVFAATVPGVGAGALYKFVLDDREVPDPYARFLPFGVHGPARVEARERVAPLRPGLDRAKVVFYEIHIGTFTPEGTYCAALERLPELASLGVTAIELMPLSSFDGARGWGYDGVAHFAPFAPYGEPTDLRAFVRGAHALGLAVFLDVVYNHFGPSGNYLGAYSPEYFTSAHKTAWGDAPSFDSAYLRAYVLDNARYWLDEMGFDGLRLDATHGIEDAGSPHVLEELAVLAHALEPRRLVFAEDERNDPSLVTRHGLDGVWADDFHHAVRVTLTGEQDGYFAGYRPGVADLARTIERGWLYEGQEYAPSGHARGARADALDAASFVYCIQNHDQVGNRALGTRLSHDAALDAYAAVSMLLLFLPMTPLLFMGQEWAATAPFLFFTDHDEALGEQVLHGRREEFKHFAAFQDPSRRAAIPDPQAVTTFERSKLSWGERGEPAHARILELYRAMLALRRDDPVLASPSRTSLACAAEGSILRVVRSCGDESRVLAVSFEGAPLPFDPGAGARCLLSSAPGAWAGGVLAPSSAALFTRTR